MDVRVFAIFDVIIFVYGFYSIVSTIKMKKTGEPGKWLIGEQPVNRMKDPVGFINHISAMTILLGIGAIAYGIIGLVDDLLMKLGMVKNVMLIIFLILFVIFTLVLQKAKAKFI